MNIVTKGIVISRKRIKENNFLITVLTDEHGVITCFHNGSKKLTSATNSGCQSFCYSQFTLFLNKDKYVVDQASAIEPFFGIATDVVKLSLCTYFGELMKVSYLDKGDATYLRLMLNTVSLLEKDKLPINQIKAIFEMRLMAMIGFCPQLLGCQNCEKSDGKFGFDFSTSGIVCTDCGTAVSISGSLLVALRHICYMPFDKIFSFTLGEKSLKDLETFSESYTLDKLEMIPKTLEFYKNLTQI